MEYERNLMTIEEFCKYVGIGKTKAREMISKPGCKYVVHIGRRVFIHKELFDANTSKTTRLIGRSTSKGVSVSGVETRNVFNICSNMHS